MTQNTLKNATNGMTGTEANATGARLNPLFGKTGMEARLHGGARIRVAKNAVFDVARNLAASDKSFREGYKGEPVSAVERTASKIFSRLGISLKGADLRNYARSVVSGDDYRFVIAY